MASCHLLVTAAIGIVAVIVICDWLVGFVGVVLQWREGFYETIGDFAKKKSIFMSELLLLVWERNKNIFIGSPSHSLYFVSHSFAHSFREFQSFSFMAATFPWGMTLWGSIELCSRFFPWRSSLLRNSWAVIVFDEFAQCGFWMQLWWTYTKPVFYC